MTDLTTRLRNLTGIADWKVLRRLDDEISSAVGKPPPKIGGYYGWEGGPGYYSKPTNSDGTTREIWESRRYTSSLTDAESLPQKGVQYKVGRDNNGRGYASACGARIHEAATPEIALCIAKLERWDEDGEHS